MKKFYSLILVLVLSLAACGEENGGTDESSEDPESSAEPRTIKLAHTGSETHQYHIAAEEFKEILEANEDVDMTVEIHSNASLGSEGDAIEQVISGSLQMTTVAGDSNLANTIPEMNVFGLPYIFEDKAHAHNALDSEAGEDILALAEESGMKGLGYWEVGLRHLTNDTREIVEPEDANGLNIRVAPAEVWESHMRAIGANPTALDFNELYSALDQGVVDGQENPLPTIDSMRFYEVQDYISLTGHAYNPAVTLMNLSFYEGLSDVEKEAVDNAVEEAKVYQRDYLDEREDEILTMLEEEGITVTEPDREAFMDATSEVRYEIEDEVPAEIVDSLIDSN